MFNVWVTTHKIRLGRQFNADGNVVTGVKGRIVRYDKPVNWFTALS
jgi:hypothetical protein